MPSCTTLSYDAEETQAEYEYAEHISKATAQQNATHKK